MTSGSFLDRETASTVRSAAGKVASVQRRLDRATRNMDLMTAPSASLRAAFAHSSQAYPGRARGFGHDLASRGAVGRTTAPTASMRSVFEGSPLLRSGGAAGFWQDAVVGSGAVPASCTSVSVIAAVEKKQRRDRDILARSVATAAVVPTLHSSVGRTASITHAMSPMGGASPTALRVGRQTAVPAFPVLGKDAAHQASTRLGLSSATQLNEAVRGVGARNSVPERVAAALRLPPHAISVAGLDGRLRATAFFRHDRFPTRIAAAVRLEGRSAGFVDARALSTSRAQEPFSWLPRVSPVVVAYWAARDELGPDDILAYVVDELSVNAALRVLRLAKVQTRDVAYKLVGSAATLPAVVDAIDAAIDAAPFLSDYKRDNLRARLKDVKDGRFLVAVRPLLFDVEEQVRSVALHRDLIVQGEGKQYAVHARPGKTRGPEMGGVEGVLRQFQFAEPQQQFHLSVAYGGRANELRHGAGADPDIDEAQMRCGLALVVLVDALAEAGVDGPREALWMSVDSMAASIPMVP